MIPLATAVGFLLIGAVLALLGTAWAGLATEHQLAVGGVAFTVALGLLGIDYRRRKL
jgi:hypothetical protein